MLERLSWKRLVFELILCCIPALILGAIFGYLPWFLLVAVTGLLVWHFWNLLRLSSVAVGRQKYDTSAGKRELGTATLRPAPDADA